MSTTYTLNVSNNSTQSGNFVIFQEMPDVNVPNVTTLAWLAKSAHPTSNLEFQWQLDYSFVWSKSTNLKPGAVVKTSQAWGANLEELNQVTFDQHPKNAYTFSNQNQGPTDGSLHIDHTDSVETDAASVGIGMSGKAAFLVESQPDTKVIMTPKSKPIYWLIHGNFEEGEVLNVNDVFKNAHQIEFEGTSLVNVSLNNDNTWSSS